MPETHGETQQCNYMDTKVETKGTCSHHPIDIDHLVYIGSIWCVNICPHAGGYLNYDQKFIICHWKSRIKSVDELFDPYKENDHA